MADRDFVYEACKIQPWSLQYASDAIKSDHEIVLMCVEQSWQCLEFADETLRGDRKIVAKAVKINGQALEYASEELQNDPELIRIAEE